MAYTAVGSAYVGNAAGSTTITVGSVNPTAIGDILVLWFGSGGFFGTPPAVSSISHTGVTTWHQLVHESDTTDVLDASIWWGVVTATGSATLTVNMSAASNSAYAAVLQFHSSNAGTWTADAASSTGTANGTSGNFPSMTPGAAGELQLASLTVSSGTFGGSTAGFVYAQTNGVGYVYDLSGPSPSTPNWTMSPSHAVALCQGALYVPSASANGNFLAFM